MSAIKDCCEVMAKLLIIPVKRVKSRIYQIVATLVKIRIVIMTAGFSSYTLQNMI
jgi:hypothetical protein